jgi:hypothetical protein
LAGATHHQRPFFQGELLLPLSEASGLQRHLPAIGLPLEGEARSLGELPLVFPARLEVGDRDLGARTGGRGRRGVRQPRQPALDLLLEHEGVTGNLDFSPLHMNNASGRRGIERDPDIRQTEGERRDFLELNGDVLEVKTEPDGGYPLDGDGSTIAGSLLVDSRANGRPKAHGGQAQRDEENAEGDKELGGTHRGKATVEERRASRNGERKEEGMKDKK